LRFESSPGKTVCETLSQKDISHKKGLSEWFKL
jgi:hypothetical protein